jgi:hypothetical protein
MVLVDFSIDYGLSGAIGSRMKVRK